MLQEDISFLIDHWFQFSTMVKSRDSGAIFSPNLQELPTISFGVLSKRDAVHEKGKGKRKH